MSEKEVRIEYLRPDQLDEACKIKPVAYFPLGALEFHGRHLPVGLDALKAHDLAIRAARKTGGLVVPPLFHGHGGEHGMYDWTWMMDAEPLIALILSTVQGLERNGIKLILLVCGHYPNYGIGETVIKRFKEAGGTAKVIAMKDFIGFPETDSPLGGDHASMCEISFMLATDESTVDVGALSKNKQGQPLSDFPMPEVSPETGWWFEKDPNHPWFGIAGQPQFSPLDASKELGEWAQERFVSYMEKLVATELPD